MTAANRRVRRPSGGWSDDRGSTLPLVPVAVLLVLVLGALVLDGAALLLAQRRLADLAAAVATDAATAIDPASFYGTAGAPAGDLTLSRALAERRRDELVALAMADRDRTFDELACTLDLVGATATAVCAATSRGLLAPAALGGGPMRLRSTETVEGRISTPG